MTQILDTVTHGVLDKGMPPWGPVLSQEELYSVVTFVKSAVSAANNAFDQVNKATKQAVEMAEANMIAASKTAPRARKAV